jgi:chromosome partitioning protein
MAGRRHRGAAPAGGNGVKPAAAGDDEGYVGSCFTVKRSPAVGEPGMDTGPAVVAFLNRKGGVGKTSSCFHLSGAMAQAGRRVLLVDMDPQASLTQGIFGPEVTEGLAKSQTVAGLFDDSCDPDPGRLVRPTGFANIAIVPGSNDLDDYNTPHPQDAGELQLALRSFLKEVRGDYDVVLVDCPPNLHLCSWSALLAVSGLVVPLQPEDYGSQGIVHVQKAIDLALAKQNPRLRLLGYLITMNQKRLGVHVAYEQQLRALYADAVFANTIPNIKDFKEAIAVRKPIGLYKPRSAAAKAIQAVAQELSERSARAADRPPEFLYLGNRVGPKDLGQEAA